MCAGLNINNVNKIIIIEMFLLKKIISRWVKTIGKIVFILDR